MTRRGRTNLVVTRGDGRLWPEVPSQSPRRLFPPTAFGNHRNRSQTGCQVTDFLLILRLKNISADPGILRHLKKPRNVRKWAVSGWSIGFYNFLGTVYFLYYKKLININQNRSTDSRNGNSTEIAKKARKSPKTLLVIITVRKNSFQSRVKKQVKAVFYFSI